MNIKNINIFRSSAIVIKINDSEQIKIDKIPAMTTLILYEDEKFINDLFEIEGILKKISESNDDIEKGKQSLSVSSKIAKFCKKYYNTIIDSLKIALNKDDNWINNNIGYMDMWNILLAIFYKNAEESLNIVKKNS